MVKTNSSHHQALNQNIKPGTGWAPLTSPQRPAPSLVPSPIRIWGRSGLHHLKIRRLKGALHFRGLWWEKAQQILLLE